MSKTNNTKNHKTVLITGATSGIGYEFAKIFAKDKHDIILIARNEDNLKKISQELEINHGVRCNFIVCDLTAHNAALEIERKIKSLGLTVDYLINNAGFGNYGLFKDTDCKRDSDCIQVNVTALTQLCKLFFPKMVERGYGGILNVASTAAYQPGPLMSVYYATKSFVASLTQAIANEAEKTGVHVTLLCPGPTATQFQEAAQMKNSKLFSAKVLKVADAHSVAIAGYKGLLANKKVVIPGVLNKIGVYSNRFVTNSFAAMVARKIQENKLDVN